MKIVAFILLSALLLGCRTEQPKATDNKIERSKTVNYVDTIHLQRTTFHSELISNGRLRAKQKSDLRLASDGIVVRLYVKNGGHVAQNGLIAELEDAEQKMRLEQAVSRMDKAQIDLHDALLGFGYSINDTSKVKAEHLKVAKTRVGYQTAIDDIKTAQLALNRRQLKAPFVGKIANLKTKEWENPKGDFFCTIIDDSEFDVEFTVLESELSAIRIGQSVKVATFIEPQNRYTGAVISINQTVDDKGRIIVVATIKNPGKLIDGMNVKVYVQNSKKNKLIVPKSAVLIRDNLEVLFRMTPEGKTIWTYVYIEAANSTSYAVIANHDRAADLNEGDVVIVGGNLNLADNVDVAVGKR